MKTFVDTSAWRAAMDSREPASATMRQILADALEPVTSEAVLLELWALVRRRVGRERADAAVTSVLASGADVEATTAGDLRRALEIAEEFPDQDFSLVDRTSFAIMRRLGISRVATLDQHFAIYRFGPQRRRAFEIAR